MAKVAKKVYSIYEIDYETKDIKPIYSTWLKITKEAVLQILGITKLNGKKAYGLSDMDCVHHTNGIVVMKDKKGGK